MKVEKFPRLTRAIAALSAGVILLALVMAPAAMAAEKPKYGGILTFAVPKPPPSFDGHRENTFALIHPVAPHYSTLLKFDQWNYPKVVGDVAKSWKVSKDGKTYTFKIRKGIKFHDGSTLTARDVKATYDKIISPPPGVVSVRKGSYSMVKSVEAPDDRTVVFRLKWPSASILANLASPWNFIYKADILAKDPHWYEKNVNGTGPFKFVEYVPGSHWIGEKNKDYFVKGRPYLDGYRAIFIKSTSARVASIRGGRALIEFRGFSPAGRDDLVRALGKKIRVQEGPWICYLSVAINNEVKPFSDVRVRRALTLALDRWEASEYLSKIAILKPVGGLLRPGSEFAATEAELTKLAGYGKDIKAARTEARRLLKEAGIPDGYEFTFKNRDLPMPYESLGIWAIDQWRKIGLNVTHKVEEKGPFFSDRKRGNFQTIMDWECGFMDEPDLQLFKFLSMGKSGANYSRFTDSTLDSLYEKQSRATSKKERRKLIRTFEKRVLDEKIYTFPTLWWYKINPHWAKVKGWNQLPSHYLNQDLRDVWLSEK
ncbi:MAG: ABC transporter substrate-binding protein [candidate division NC10 bacterium]|nr:ABC transporter substrate-binding protein [candidate division NC10 bacterium]